MLTERRANWQHFVCDPTAPSNYKPDTAERFIQRKREEQEAVAGTLPYSGYVKSLAVLDAYGSLVLRAECAPGETVSASLRFLDYVSLTPATWVDRVSTSTNEGSGVRWFCLNARCVFPMLAAEILRYNGAEGREQPVAVPTRLWWYDRFKQPGYDDPYEMLVPSSQRADMDLFALCDFLNISLPPGWSTDAVQLALLTYQLAVRGQLSTGLIYERAGV